MYKTKYNLIVITGATASSKTNLAAHLAKIINGEIISADSRQVYRNMDIGTGKDIQDYTINGYKVPYHLIDIVDAGYKYNVYEFQKDFYKTFEDITSRNKIPILCGGTGLYIDSVLNKYKLIHVPINEILRKQLESYNLSELELILANYKKLHNKTDVDTKKRAIRAIEIADYYANNQILNSHIDQSLTLNPIIFGVLFSRETRRDRITKRLEYRLNNGMIEEVNNLLKNGLTHEDLEYYGLEYKYISHYISGLISYETLFEQLNTAIHQFAKRQMTWFRKMEKEGVKINWIDGELSLNEKLDYINRSITNSTITNN